MNSNVWMAFGLTAVAGLSTGIGSVIALFTKKGNNKFLAVSLGFSAGVMLYVSMVEILVKAQDALQTVLGGKPGAIAAACAFFGGMFLIALLDRLVPARDNPHKISNRPTQYTAEERNRLMRTGVHAALAVALHNFSEGLATFAAALQAPSLALPVVAAIAIHNIPEGIVVSVPIYYATGNKKKAFFYSFVSGLTELLGALVSYFLLLPFMGNTGYGVLFAAAAGIMVFISLDELLPLARKYGGHHLSIYGAVAGMLVMAVSLLLFA